MIAERRGNLCVLLISQNEVDIRRLLLHIPPLDLQEFPEYWEEIQAYISRKLIKLRQKFSLSNEIELEIEDKVTKHADGEWECVACWLKASCLTLS